jgi:hypothetical protein
MERVLNEIELAHEMSFYENVNDLALSASAIKLLIDSPKAYYEDYVLGNKEQKKGKHFDEGSLVHCMVLEPEELNNKFINMGVATPTDSIKGCIDHLLSLGRNASELEEYSEEIITYLQEINLHQSLVDDKKAPWLTGDEKRLAKVINDNSREYFRLMIESREKTIVDSASWQKCLDKADAINKNPKAHFLLNVKNPNDEVRYELELRHKFDNVRYTLKGVLDAIKVDREEKIIYVSDIKTTNGLLKDFKASSEKFNYWLQEAIYNQLAKSLLTGNGNQYKLVFHFIVVDRMNDVYCFPVSAETSETWAAQLEELINVQVDYHISNKDFTLPYEFANNLVSL